METYKPQPLEERKSQKLTFWDFSSDKLFWGVLPLATSGAAMLLGKITKFKIWPLDGSPDILTTLYAYGTKFFTKGALKEEVSESTAKWVKDGMWVGELIDKFGGVKEKRDLLRKYYFNFVKGAEVATPFSAYFLWHKKEGNRLDLEDAGNRLKKLQTLKPSDTELAEQNEAMRRELDFAARMENIPPAIIDKSGAEHHGTLAERQKELA